MKAIFLIIGCFISICYNAVLAQGIRPYTVEMNSDSLYQNALSYLCNEDYFIDCVDSSAGFIKAKKFTVIDKLLSVYKGQRTEVSMFIKPISERKSSISVTTYIETLEHDESIIFHKEGLCNDSTLCMSIINGIISVNQD